MGELYVHTMAGSTDFPKHLKPFQKPRCQKSDKKEVHNLKFRYCVGVVAHNLKVPSVCLSPHSQLCLCE